METDILISFLITYSIISYLLCFIGIIILMILWRKFKEIFNAYNDKMIIISLGFILFLSPISLPIVLYNIIKNVVRK